jgi:hypothetical protein
MITQNGTEPYLSRRDVLMQLDISNSTLDRFIKQGKLTVAKRIDRGPLKPSPMFDPRAVAALAEQRRQTMRPRVRRHVEATASPTVETPPPFQAPPPSSPQMTPALLVTAVKALHNSQVSIMQALETPSRVEIEAELWHVLWSLTRSQEHILSEVLIDTPLPVETEVQP